MKNAFHFYADAGHGWLMVTESDMADVGLTVEDFSRYSYVNGPRYYLEEDADASLFIEAYRATNGAMPEILEHVETCGDSLIRTYSRLPDTGRSFEERMSKLASYRARAA